MSISTIPRFGTWSQPGQTQTAGTAILIPIWPYPGQPGNGMGLYRLNSAGQPALTAGGGGASNVGAVTHISHLGITTGSTAHTIYVMRPLNFTTVSVAGAINTTSLTIAADPGNYATNYKYPTGSGGVPVSLANNLIATNDYFATQLSDGSWFFDKIAGVSGLVITTTTTIPNVTGGGIPVGSVFWWFGIQTDKDPATGAGQPSFQPNVSAYTDMHDEGGDGVCAALHPGDPLYLYDGNGTGADIINFVSGYYGKI